MHFKTFKFQLWGSPNALSQRDSKIQNKHLHAEDDTFKPLNLGNFFYIKCTNFWYIKCFVPNLATIPWTRSITQNVFTENVKSASDLS